MSKVYGVSAFGLNDGIMSDRYYCPAGQLNITSISLPANYLGVIQSCDTPGAQRVHSGIYWPPSARVDRTTKLRRVPASLAWSMLVKSGDKSITWEAENGVNFSLSSILEAHIINQIKLNDREIDGRDQYVIAIPNHLDEYGQDLLLKALHLNRTINQFSLLWRPVASAMAWLNEVDIDNLNENDGIIVAYIGPDAIEFTALGLKKKKHNNQSYILPIRSRPRHRSDLTGWDFACSLAEKFDPVCAEDIGALWQVLTAFPEVWMNFAGDVHSNHSEICPWSTRHGWRNWAPSTWPSEMIFDLSSDHSGILDSLISNSFKIDHGKEKTIFWGDYLKSEFDLTLKQIKGQLRGIVFCGSLFPKKVCKWLPKDFQHLPISQTPVPDSIWIPVPERDSIAEGAKIFGTRLRNNAPTYYDTLPGLSLLTQKRGALDWVDIVNSGLLEGGKEYHKKIENRFFLSARNDKMSVYLSKDSQEISDTKHWKGEPAKTPYRYGEIFFPAIPDHDVALNLEVNMRPASGLAKVVFNTVNTEFLRDQPVSFDYSRMKPIITLPEPEIGWPEDQTLKVNTEIIDDNRLNNFIDFLFPPHEFINRLNSLKEGIVSTKIINENGFASNHENQMIIEKIKKKIEEGTKYYLNSPDYDPVKFIVRASWLWGSTPNIIVTYLNKYFNSPESSIYNTKWNNFVEAASRCFDKEDQFSLLFEAAYKRFLRQKTNYPMSVVRSLSRVLNYRKDGWKGLNEKMAFLFVDCSLGIVEEEKNNIGKKFFTGAYFFLSLLKYRIKDKNFMDYQDKNSAQRFEKLEECLQHSSRKIAKQNNNKNDALRIQELIQGVIDYMHYKGKHGLINDLENAADN